MPPKDTVAAFAQLLAGLPSREEFVKSFEGVVKTVKGFEKKLTEDFSSLVATLNKKIDDRLSKVKNGDDGHTPTSQELVALIKPLIPAPVKGDDGDTPSEAELVSIIKPLIPIPEPGKDGSPDTAEDIRNKLELLDGDERLDAKYIKNLPEPKKGDTHIVGSHGPLWSLADVDVAGIVTGQSIKWDGTRWIPFTPAGGTTTSVYEESPTDSGDQTNFTLAHIPVANTLRLYRGGARQQLGTDYTLSTDTITLSVVLQAGETLLADYEY